MTALQIPNPNRRWSRRGLLGAGLGLASLLAGCGGDDDTAPPLAPAGSGSPVTIVPGYTDTTKWAGRTLVVAAFGGEIQTALRTAMFRPFSLATGCTIQEAATDYGVLATSVAGGTAYADLLLVDPLWLAAAANVATLAPIGELPAATFKPIAATQSSVPAYVYALVNCFRRDVTGVREHMESWRDWWDLDTFNQPRALPARALGTFEAALLADGVKPGKLYPLDIERALRTLEKIGATIGDRWWTSGEQPVVWLDRGDASLAAAWHHRVLAAQFDGRPIDFVWEEGLFVADHWVIPDKAAAPDIARDFIAYASTREVQANLALAVPLGPVNPGAFAFLPARLTPRLPTAPQNVDKLVRIDPAWWTTNGDAAQQRFDTLRATFAGTPTP